MKTFRLLNGSLLFSLTISVIAPLVGASPIIILPAGAEWRYSASGTDLGTAWREVSFNDSAWSSGRAQLGFGDGDEVTVLQSGIVTAYFRRSFQSQVTGATTLTLRLLRDDGAVVYINGVEVFRNNMPPGAVSYGTFATATVGGAEETTQFITAQIDPNVLVQGANLVAVEVHQVNITSSDLSFDLELIAEPGPVLPVLSVQAIDPEAAELSPLVDAIPNAGAFRITRDGPLTSALQVAYTLSGTASNGVDYAQLSGTAELPAGATSVDVVVDVIYDMNTEGDETVVLRLIPPLCAAVVPPPPGCYGVGSPDSVTVVIHDSAVPNIPPTVRFASPTNGAIFVGPTSILLNAIANDLNGYLTIQTVEFFEGTHSLGIRTNFPTLAPINPFMLQWQNLPLGEYTLSAIATDDHGARGTSAPVPIRVVSSPGEVSLVALGAVWKYMDQGIDLGTAWREVAFDDSAWASGPAQLGYGDGDEATVASFGPDPNNKFITTYFRRSFQIPNDASISALRGRLLQDDGGAVYLNDVEVFRSNLPLGPLPFNTLAIVASPDNQIVEFTAPASLLHEGLNVVAVEMHQNSPVSSDLSFDLELLGQVALPPPELPVVIVVATDPDAAESGALAAIFPGTFTFSRSGPTSNTLTAFFTLSGSAENGVDYRYVSNSVRFNPGQTQARVDIFPLNDNLVEGIENMVLTLQEPACAAIVPPPPGCYRVGPSNRAEVFIKDANPPENHLPYVQLNEPRSGDVFTVPTNIVLRAFADDAEDGNNITVEFLANGGSLGFGTFVPTLCPAPYCPYFQLIWSNPPPGDYTLIARATDKAGGSSNSAPANIIVRGLGPLSPAADNQEWPAVATDGVNYFAVWMDRRNRDSAWNDYDIYGARISSAGEVLDRGGIPICARASTQWYPSVAFDGNNFLVVWSDDRDNADGIPRLEIYGARVSREGRVLDTNGFKITHGEIAYQPTVAFNGSFYLIGAYARQHNGQSGDTVIAVRVTPAGVVLDTEEIVLFGPKGNLSPVVVASVGGNWLVAWNYAGGIQASLVSVNGSVGLPSYIGNRGDTWMRGLTAVGNNYFLTMVANRQLNPDTVVMDIYGAWIDAAGQPFKTLLVSSNTSQTTGSGSGQPTIHLQNHATAAGTGSEALVVWEAGAVYTNGGNQRWTSDIRAASVTTTGSVSAPFSVCAAPQDQAVPSIAFNGQHFLAVWEDARTAPPYEENPFSAFDIYGARLTLDGNVLEPNGFLISGAVSNHPPLVTIMVPGDGAVFDASETIQIRAVTVDPDGFASTVEFFANDQKIGEATGRPGPSGQPINFEFNWSNAHVGQYRLTARTTDNAGARATSVPVNITVRERDNHELHIVGIYAGVRTGNNSYEEGRATVVANRPGKLVTLFLSSYWPVLWSVSASADTTIERVYLIGYYPVRVEGIAPDAEVIRESFNYFVGSDLESGLFYRVAPKVRRLTGQEIASFHGYSVVPASTPFVIDSVQEDPRLRSDYPVPTPLSELPDLRFSISFYSGAGVYHVGYTLAGPDGGGNLLSWDERAVPGDDGKYYVIRGDGVLQVDPVAGTSRPLPVPPNLPEVSWAMGIAYDSQRHRVLLVTLGGEGFLYAYSPADDRWSVVSSMDNRDLASLTYHAHDDSLYGMGVTSGDAGQMTLYRLNASGRPAGEMNLPIYPWGVHISSSELVSVGEYLVLLLNPEGANANVYDDDVESRMYLINPATGEFWLTVRQPRPPVPNEPPRVLITAPSDGAVFAPGASIQITALTEDSDNFATKVEFFANGLKIGETLISPETGGDTFAFTWQNVQAGEYALTATATDSRGGVGTSPPVNIRVGDDLQPAPGDQQSPAVAANNELYLVVWADSRGANGGIYAARITPEGQRLDPDGIRISTRPGGQGFPAVASDGRDFLVTWHESGDAPTYSDIYGARVTAEGVVLDPNGFPISRAPFDQFGTSVAFNGAHFLVAWYDYRNSDDVRLRNDIYGARVGRDGVVLDPAGIAICTADNMQWAPGVAALSGDFFVAWDDSRGQVRGSRVTSAGVVSNPDGLVLSQNFSGYAIRVAANASGYLSVWTDGRNYETTRYDIFGRRMSATGALVGTSDFVLCNAPGMQVSPALAAGNDQFLAVWYDERGGISAARIGANGVLDPNGFPIGNGPASEGWNAISVGSLNGQYLAAWTRGYNSDFGQRDIVAVRVTADGEVLDSNPLLVSTATSQDVDSDEDGVPDDDDSCFDTPPGAIVDANGCSLSQLCPCDASWPNHAAYVGCVIGHAWQFFRAGLITRDQRREAIRDAVQSDCGKHPPQREPTCIHLLPLTGEECQRDGVQFVISGDATGPCVLECSEDLINWRTVEPVSITGWEIACPMEAGTRARFYRVRGDP